MLVESASAEKLRKTGFLRQGTTAKSVPSRQFDLAVRLPEDARMLADGDIAWPYFERLAVLIVGAVAMVAVFGKGRSSADTPIPAITEKDFPALYQCADSASLSAQKTYLLLQRTHVTSLILGSAVAAFATIVADSIAPRIYSLVAVILALGVLVLWIARSRRDDKVWFDCRAIAESSKTAAWRFMMRAAPFNDNGSAKRLFVSELREIREARPERSLNLAGSIDADASAISDFMSEVRTRTFEERKSFFINARLRDQKSWYSKKAKLNSSSESRWFWLTSALQAFAVAFAIFEASSGGFGFHIVPILTTCAAAVIAWSQMKRHSELAQTYSLSAQELGELESIAVDLADEDEFLSLVEQVEETVSREHTMWCARREVVLSPRE